MNRRSLLGLSALGLLAGCASVKIGGVTLTPDQIVSDVNTALLSLQKAVAGIRQVAPTLIPAAIGAQIDADLTIAATFAHSVSDQIAAAVAAPSVQKVETALNAVVESLAAIPAIPGPYGTALIAVSVVLPVIEAFVNQYLGTASARARSLAPNMSPDAARQTLAQFLAS